MDKISVRIMVKHEVNKIEQSLEDVSNNIAV
jgi:hypothetical protein